MLKLDTESTEQDYLDPSSECDAAYDTGRRRGPGPVRIIVWVAAGLILLATLSVVVTAAVLPGCSRCHNSAYFVEQTQSRSHTKIGCISCHASSGAPHRVAYAYNLILGKLLHLVPVDGGPTTSVSDGTCLSCHSGVMYRRVAANGLRILHARCAKGRMCTECHSDTAHGSAVKGGKTVNMNQCLDCHNTDRVRSDCDLCHVEKNQQDRIRTGDWAVIHGPYWKKTHGMGKVRTCAACHPPEKCKRCHHVQLPHDSSFIRLHPSVAKTQLKDCAVCHKPIFCLSCHGLQMPHSGSFVLQHPKSARRIGQDKCLKCHVQDDCVNCHIKHVHPGGAIEPPKVVTQ